MLFRFLSSSTSSSQPSFRPFFHPIHSFLSSLFPPFFTPAPPPDPSSPPRHSPSISSYSLTLPHLLRTSISRHPPPHGLPISIGSLHSRPPLQHLFPFPSLFPSVTAVEGPISGPSTAKTPQNAVEGPAVGPSCTFLILVDSDWSLPLKEVDSGLTLLLV